MRGSGDSMTRKRRRRPRPAPLSLDADTLTDESVDSDQSSLKSSSLSPMSSVSPSTPNLQTKTIASSHFPRFSPKPPMSHQDPPKSPGIVRSTRCSPFMSPRNISPALSRHGTPSHSPYHSPAPSSPRCPFPPSPTYQPGFCSPRSPRSPASVHMSRSPSPRPRHMSPGTSSPRHTTPMRSPQFSGSMASSIGDTFPPTNLAILASRRKMSLAAGGAGARHHKQVKQVAERRTSNFLELPGKFQNSSTQGKTTFQSYNFPSDVSKTKTFPFRFLGREFLLFYWKFSIYWRFIFFNVNSFHASWELWQEKENL